MRLHRLWLVGFLIAVLAGCGGSSSSGDGGADPAQAIPAGVPVYVEGAVRPSGDQGDAARALIAKFMPPGKTLEGLLDESIKSEEPDKSYAKDIKPWLGERAGIGVLDLTADEEPSFVAAIAVTDAEKAEDFLSSSNGVKKDGEVQGATVYRDDDTIAAVKDDYLVFSQTKAVLDRSLQAIGGDSLAESETFENAVGELPEERLGALYVDVKSIGDIIAKSPDVDPAGRAILQNFFGGDTEPLTAALTATESSATIESRFSGSGVARLSSFGLLGGSSTKLVEDAPADAFAVFGAADVGSSVKGMLDLFAGALGGAALTGQLEAQTGVNLERDVFSWIGDIAVYAHGGSVPDLNGAVVIGTTDDDAAAQAIPRLVAAAKRSGAPVTKADVAGADQAFAVAAPEAPGPVVLAQGNGRVVLAFGEDEAADALKPSGDTFGDSGRFSSAKDAIDGLQPSLVLSLPTVFALVEQSGEADADYREAKPYLDKLDLVVTGSEKDGDTLRSLFTITTR
jgi:hypothetical protein